MIAEHMAESMQGIKSASTVPVSEVGLCVTHWASGSSFAENDIRLTFSREGEGVF